MTPIVVTVAWKWHGCREWLVYNKTIGREEVWRVENAARQSECVYVRAFVCLFGAGA